MRSSTIPRGARATLLRLIVAAVALGLLSPSAARAHFLWLTGDRAGKSPEVRAFLSETPTPEGPEFLKHIAKATITAGERTLSWSRAEDTYRVSLPDPCPAVIDGFCDLGVMKRNGATFRLIYTARVQLGPSLGKEAEASDHLRLKLVARPGSPAVVAVTFRGEPAAGAVVKAFPEDGDPVELKADAQGRLEYLAAAEGRAGLLARWSVKEPGQIDGKSYDEVRYYATLTVVPAATAGKPGAAVSAAHAPFAALPQAIDSFGGAVLGDWLYVYGGHTGKMHKYSRETASKHFRRLNLRDRTTWEELPGGPALQGVTLVSHGGRLYRIGGMAPHNAPGEPNDLVSVADFARFDPGSKTWTSLPPLPTPRSTHDSVVVGDKIYVIGGWSMNGGDSANAEFLETALVFDLSRAGAGWEDLPAPPFRRRALAVGAVGGKVYALGGLTEDGKVVKSVDLYDPATRTWSRGPDLPGSKRQGFAPSAFGVGGKLYVSGIDGQVLQFAPTGDRWEVAETLATPRLSHRLLPGIADDLLAVGGSAAGTPIPHIESIPLGGPSPRESRP
jgi:N-acetylneuraminic acid mutarotase